MTHPQHARLRRRMNCCPCPRGLTGPWEWTETREGRRGPFQKTEPSGPTGKVLGEADSETSLRAPCKEGLLPGVWDSVTSRQPSRSPNAQGLPRPP